MSARAATSPRPKGGALLAVLILAGLLLAACTGARPTLGDDPIPTTTTEAPVESEPARVAEAQNASIDVFAGPTDPVPIRTLVTTDVTTGEGTPMVLVVKDTSDDRYEVYLPAPPVGSTGWVDRDEVRISTVDLRIEISITQHRIRVIDGQDTLFDEPVSLGIADRPVAGEPYFLKELLRPPRADGPYGVYAYGLSGTVADEAAFATGLGVVGIHGTSNPDLLGQDAPIGSVGVHNDVITRMVEEIGLPLGTPVEVEAIIAVA